MKKVTVSCQGSHSVDLEKILAFQGELKSLSKKNYEKLKGLILTNGITAPVHVWTDPKGNLWNLDGHQRVRVLEQLKKEGYKIPQVPVVLVSAKDEKTAKSILLSNVSQFGSVESEGLYEFITENEISPETLGEFFDLPNVDMSKFMESYFLENQEEPEAGPGRVSSNDVVKIHFTFSAENHKSFVKRLETLAKKYGKDNLSDAIMEAVKRLTSSADSKGRQPAPRRQPHRARKS